MAHSFHHEDSVKLGLAREDVFSREFRAPLQEHLDLTVTQLANSPVDSIADVSGVLWSAREKKANVFIFGNGGSAATALHLANDLVRLESEMWPAFRASCLNGNVSVLTCLANDQGYENVFGEQIATAADSGDVAIAISTSGNSPNCLNALKVARDLGLTTIGLTGSSGGTMLGLCDYAVRVPCDDCLIIESCHIAISHALSRCLSSKSEVAKF